MKLCWWIDYGHVRQQQVLNMKMEEDPSPEAVCPSCATNPATYPIRSALCVVMTFSESHVLSYPVAALMG